jgi:hypothetical protein
MNYNNNLRERNYPEVLFPKRIRESFVAHPTYPSHPMKPMTYLQKDYISGVSKLMKKQPPKEPIKPTRRKDEGSFVVNLWFLVFVNIMIVPFVFAVFEGGWFAVLIINVILVILYTWAYISSKDNEEKEYQRAINSYPRKIEEYKNDLKKYEQEMEESNIAYKAECEKYEQELARLKSQEYLFSFRQNLFLSQLRSSKTPSAVDTTNVKKGVSESSFYLLLKKKYGNNIIENYCLNGNPTAFPDMLYWDKSINLIIDIEIDEPYVGSSGEPIHYLLNQIGNRDCRGNDMGEKYYGFSVADSVDEWRDKAMNDVNWIVIRFAEQQIFQNSDGCIKFIDYVIEKVKKMDIDFSTQTFILPIKRWTKDEAHNMAYRRFRQSYVPVQYHDLLKIENNCEEDNDATIRNRFKQNRL